jgi:GTP-binding protein
MKRLDKAAQAYQIVLTKIDAVAPERRAATVAEVAAAVARHPAAHPTVVATSAETGEGIAALRAVLADLAAPHPFR